MKKTIILISVIAFTLAAILFLFGCSSPAETNKSYNPAINPNDFVTEINNKYFTLTPGKTFVYEGKTDEGIEHIEVTTLDEIKVVMEVECRVVWDRVWLDGNLIEDTKDFYAQYVDGNVWYFGEESKTLENGEVVSTKGSWQAGVDGAKPGIIMLAEPKVGDEYRQEYYEGEAEDMGKVEALGQSVQTPYGKFENCLKTRDFTPLEDNVDEYKYYSPYIGNLVQEVGVYSKDVINLIDVKT